MLSILITHDTQVGLLTGSTPLGVRQATMALKRGMRRRRRNPHTMRRLENRVQIPGDTMMAAEQSCSVKARSILSNRHPLRKSVTLDTQIGYG